MKRFGLILLAAALVFSGCLATRYPFEEQAVDVTRLTLVMHSQAIRMHYACNTNLPPEEVQQLFDKVIDEHPALDIFGDQLIKVKWCNGEIDLMLFNKKTGTATYEDISCTAKLDRRWYSDENPPKEFTLSHPDTCHCSE